MTAVRAAAAWSEGQRTSLGPLPVSGSGSRTQRAGHKPPKPNPLSFPKATSPFSKSLFQEPTVEYRGCPLWAWNSRLDKDQLLRQIDYLKAMGMGGFHMHSRVGLDTDYMGKEFMDLVESCVDTAEKKGMLACLYDEDRWPSGSAGGLVVKKYPQHKAKHLLFTPNAYGSVGPARGCSPASAQACRSESGYMLGKYAVKLDGDGRLESTRAMLPNEPVLLSENESLWYAYVETNPPSPWFNDQTYVDTLSHDALAAFIDVTYEKYKSKVGSRFGSTVPCCFTDEPQFAIKTRLPFAQARQDIFLPWTDDLPKTFAKAYGGNANLVKDLPQLIWDLPGAEPATTRYRYHDHVCERFVSAFMDQLADWCGQNGLLLNGHMMDEPTLGSQTGALGEAMRCYRAPHLLPGIDLLNDWVEYNTAKQASSVARQKGSRGCMSEIYGCTHWFFTFEGHKGCGDWQAALGITFRVPHLSWVSMRGEGKRDYPASINYQSPWFREYGYVEDHFARVAVAMTRGTARARVAVIHPIESYWLAYGPAGADEELGWRDQRFADLTNTLLHGLIDFDFISESMLPSQFGGVSGGKLKVGCCEYEAVVMPNLRTVRSTTLRILAKFARAGGKVVVAGQKPDLIDAQVPLTKLDLNIMPNVAVPWDGEAILAALQPFRDIDITSADGLTTRRLLYQMRQDGHERFVFICNTDRDNGIDTTVRLKGRWDVELLDTLSGRNRWLKSGDEYGWTTFPYRFEGCASLLLRLYPVKRTDIVRLPPAPEAPSSVAQEMAVILESVELSEPNVLMLDWARYKINEEGDWSHLQEILAIDNEIRDRLRLPRKGGAWRQPWTISEEQRKPVADISLLFSFLSDVDVDQETKLAIELPPAGRSLAKEYGTLPITINGWSPSDMTTSVSGFWVDEGISTVTIPAGVLVRGQNKVILRPQFGVLTDIERIYVLGNFTVELIAGGGDNKSKIASLRAPSSNPSSSSAWSLPPPAVTWGNVTLQGFPFYVGNVVYGLSFSLQERGQVTLSVPNFSSPVLKVSHRGTGEKAGHIALQPRQLDLGVLNAGKHNFDVTCFGNRYNAFGHVHLSDQYGGCHPDVWRSQGWAWSDDYKLKPIGILECPTVIVREAKKKAEQGGPGSEEWIVVHRPSAK